jgi:hypothetical protein
MGTPEQKPEPNAETENVGGSGKPEKPWLFKKGQSGNPGGQPKGGREEGDLDLLRAMRHVAKRRESRDRTPLQKECRAWLKEDRKGFMMRWADLEKAHVAKAGSTAAKAKPPAEPEEDLKEEEVLKLIGKLIDDFNRTGEGGRCAKCGRGLSPEHDAGSQ